MPTKTIRYYEDIGILPHPARTDSGYREYDEPAVGRLQFIRAAQSIGFTLGEIRETLAVRDRGEEPCAHVRALIERHAIELTDKIASLEAMRADLQRLAKKSSRESFDHCDEATICHIIQS